MTSTHPDDAQISEFWAWFSAVAEDLARNLENPRILDELDSRIARLGDLAWELGPGEGARYALAISPDGDRELLPLTLRIVSFAPHLPSWEFLPARRARNPALEFELETDRGELHVDAGSWRYVLYRFPDKTFDLVLEQSNLGEATDEDKYAAAIILLDGLLGEATRLLHVGDIEITSRLALDQEPKASSIASLPAHLESLC